MPKWLIAVDGSEAARRAVELAARWARLVPELQAVLLNVREMPVYYGELPPLDAPVMEQAGQERQQALLEAALTHAKASGLANVVTQGEQGLAAQEIVRVAAEHQVDQIVMGTRGMSALGGLFLGSVAQRVVHLASAPVLLVK